MAGQMMIYLSRVRDFVVGIDYDSVDEDKGHMTIRRKVHLKELVKEIKTIILNGSRFPQFPAEANPTIIYAWDMNNPEDGDVYHEIMLELEKNNRMEVIY